MPLRVAWTLDWYPRCRVDTKPCSPSPGTPCVFSELQPSGTRLAPIKNHGQLPVVKYHINVVSCKILEVATAAVAVSEARPVDGPELPTSAARFLNGHLDTDGDPGDRSLLPFSPVGSVYRQGLAWQPHGLLWAGSRARTLLGQQDQQWAWQGDRVTGHEAWALSAILGLCEESALQASAHMKE